MQASLQFIVITGIFALCYPLLRSLPDVQCGFLHYDYAGDTDDGAELCGTDNNALFLDLQQVRFPVRGQLSSKTPPQIGRPTPFTLALTMPDGTPVTVEELAVVHTKKLHLFVISPDLQDYHHQHPQPLATPGHYRFTITPRHPGRYIIFAEMVPLRSASVMITQMAFTVSAAPPNGGAPSPSPAPETTRIPDRYQLTLNLPDSESWRCNTTQEFTLSILDTIDTQSPLPLERVMGAYAHLVAFDIERRGLAHMHPLNEKQATLGSQRQFRFALRTDRPGNYVIWAQVKLAGQEYLVPFPMVAYPG